MKILIALLIFSIGLNSFAQESSEAPTSLSDYKDQKLEKLIQRFAGTYQSQNGDFLTLEHLSFYKGKFDLRTLGTNSTFVYGANDSGLDFLLEDKIETRKTGYMGKVIRETSYRLNPYGVTKVVVATNILFQRREITTTDYRIGEDWILRRNFSRLYYKRKYIYFGEWVPDTTSFNGKKNSHELQETYVKVHTDIIDLEEIAKRRRNSGFETTYKLNKGGGAEEVREAIERGEYTVVVKPKAKPRLYRSEGGVLYIENNPKHSGALSFDGEAKVISIADYKILQCRYVFAP